MIPCLNEEQNIAKCIRSLQAQKRPPNEIVVVDNGSKDRTVEVSMGLGARVLGFPPPDLYGGNIGLVRQKGTEEAGGDIIVSTDADCTFPPEYLERVEAYFTGNPKLVLLSGPVYPSNPEDLDAWTEIVMSTLFFYNTNFHKSYCAALGVPTFRGSNTSFRKSAFNLTEGYKGAAGHGPVEEWIVSFRLSRVGEYAYADDVYVYTVVPGYWRTFCYALPLSVLPTAVWAGLMLGM